MAISPEETEEYHKDIAEIGDLILNRVDKLWEDRPSLRMLPPKKQQALIEISTVAVLSDVSNYIERKFKDAS